MSEPTYRIAMNLHSDNIKSRRNGLLSTCLILCLACTVIVPRPLLGQPTPVDLTELGLEEILAMPIIRESQEALPVERHFADRFRFGYQYLQARFEDYQDGTHRLSIADVQTLYPVVPAKITQEAHLFKIGYELNNRLLLNLQVPLIRQSTFHFGPPGGIFEEFTIDTAGLGDIALSAAYVAWVEDNHAVIAEGGFSFPTGSIEELGRTPRSATMDTIVPYTMQLGSGTVDFKPAISYVGNSDWLEWGTRAQGTIRLGRNSRDYSLSHRFTLRNWITLTTYRLVQPSLRLTTEIWDRIHGADRALFGRRSDGSLFNPAPVTDPDLYGGEKVSAGLGLRFPIRNGFLSGQTVELEGSIPLFQNLNGPQPNESWRFSVAWNWQL